MSIRIVLDSGVWHPDARVRVLESGVQSHDSVVRPLLQAIRKSIQLCQVWLFPGRSSGHLCTKTVLRTIDRLAEEAGFRTFRAGRSSPEGRSRPISSGTAMW